MILVNYSDGHDHDFSRSPIVDQFRQSFSNDRRSSIFLLDHFLTIVDRVIILIIDRRSWISIILLYKRMNSGLLHEPLMIHAILASTHPFTPSYQYIYIYIYIPMYIFY